MVTAEDDKEVGVFVESSFFFDKSKNIEKNVVRGFGEAAVFASKCCETEVLVVKSFWFNLRKNLEDGVEDTEE